MEYTLEHVILASNNTLFLDVYSSVVVIQYIYSHTHLQLGKKRAVEKFESLN